MTEHHVEVVRLKNIQKHPNADSLSIATIHDNYPVIFKTSEFSEGELVVYVPVDSIVPDTEEWAWLAPAGAALRDKDRRIKAKRLRGVFSMGLVVKPSLPNIKYKEGDDVAEALGITRYEPDADVEAAPKAPKRKRPKSFWGWLHLIWDYFFGPEPLGPPRLKYMPGVYDIEPFRKHGKSWFIPGETVVVTEKIHGQNASFVHDGKRLHVKSRTRWRANDPTESENTWARVAKKYELEKKLAAYPGILLFGETYGNNADMPYGVDRAKEGDRFVAFDAYDTSTGQYLDHDDFRKLCELIDVPTAPVMATLVWDDRYSYDYLVPFAEGKTWMKGATHLREGFVVKPIVERRINGGQRVILKMAGEGYLTRKAA